jgi:hypothetical protein
MVRCHIRRTTVSEHTAPRRRRELVGSLDGPSKTITVEPIQVPVIQPRTPDVEPESPPKRAEPAPEREPVPAR